MQHLNDDMDELFRKAADDYPLNTGGADWNRVMKGLSQDQSPAAGTRDRKYRRFFWLFLLLPLGFVISEIVNPYWFKPATGERSLASDKRQPTANNDRKNSEQISAQRSDKSAEKISSAEGGANNPEEIISLENGQDRNESPETSEDKTNTGQDGNTSLQKADNTGNVVAPVNRHGGNAVTKAGKPIAADSRQGSDLFFGNNSQYTKSRNAGAQSKPGNINESFSTALQNSVVPGREDSLQTGDLALEPYIELPAVTGQGGPDVSAPPAEPLILPLGPIRTQQIKNKNFYIGGIGGLDITTIRFQQTSKIGNHYGAIAGYSFAKKWSVEVGFIVDKKYYYSDGKYFDRTKLNLNPNTTIISVDGECKMFEIPVSIKYDITNSYRSSFFVTAGLSSYIMKKEDYTMVWGYASGSRGTHYYPYKNSSKNLFAELRLTTGYSIKLPQSFSIRMEPYVNIPLAGVGYGKLNLMSAGINAGIFKRIF